METLRRTSDPVWTEHNICKLYVVAVLRPLFVPHGAAWTMASCRVAALESYGDPPPRGAADSTSIHLGTCYFPGGLRRRGGNANTFPVGTGRASRVHGHSMMFSADDLTCRQPAAVSRDETGRRIARDLVPSTKHCTQQYGTFHGAQFTETPNSRVKPAVKYFCDWILANQLPPVKAVMHYQAMPYSSDLLRALL